MADDCCIDEMIHTWFGAKTPELKQQIRKAMLAVFVEICEGHNFLSDIAEGHEDELAELDFIVQLPDRELLRLRSTPVYPHLMYRREILGNRHWIGDWRYREMKPCGLEELVTKTK